MLHRRPGKGSAKAGNRENSVKNSVQRQEAKERGKGNSQPDAHAAVLTVAPLLNTAYVQRSTG